MSSTSIFEHIGYGKDYYVNNKYIGSTSQEDKDRDVYGYGGKKTEILEHDVICTNKKKIKANTTVVTQLFPLCGKIKKHIHDKFRASLTLNQKK